MSKREIVKRSVYEMREQYKTFLRLQAKAYTRDEIEVAIHSYNVIFTEIDFLCHIGILSLEQAHRLEDIFRNAFRKLMFN